jgi:hypothetical protein
MSFAGRAAVLMNDENEPIATNLNDRVSRYLYDIRSSCLPSPRRHPQPPAYRCLAPPRARRTDAPGVTRMAHELDRLYGIASDDETVMLDRLTLRAGIVWHCPCGWHNDAHLVACEDCGRARP